MKRISDSKNIIKKVLPFFAVLFFLIITGISLAQEPGADKAQTASKSAVLDNKVQELKDKLATQVAELRQAQKRGFSGTIAALSKTSFTLATSTAEIRVRYNNDAIVYDLGAKHREKKADDLKNGQVVSVLGFYDSEAEIHHAKIILLEDLPLAKTGTIQSLDADTASLIVKDGKESVTIDYEKKTVGYEYTGQGTKIAKSGFSRLKAGDYLHVWATVNETDSKRYQAVTLLRLPNDVASPSPTEQKESSPSAKPSSKASPKTSPKSSPTASADKQ